MTPLLLRLGEHYVVDTALARSIRRIFRDRNFITVFNARYGVWMICRWVKRAKGLVVEEGALPRGRTPYNADRTILNQLMWKYSTSSEEMMRQISYSAKHNGQIDESELQDQADEHLAMRRYLRRKAGVHYGDHWVFDAM